MESNSQSVNQNAEALQVLASGPLASAVSKLSAASRAIPHDKDFYFFNNFHEFKKPIKEISSKAQSLLKQITSSSPFLFGKQSGFPDDIDDSLEDLVNTNDDLLEKFDVSVDEFKNSRQAEEEASRQASSLMTEGGFQMVRGKMKKTKTGTQYGFAKDNAEGSSSSAKISSSRTKCTEARSRVPFHMPYIPRPQDEYGILVDNSNQPFDHVCLQKSEDGSRFIHPLEEFCAQNFVDRDSGSAEPLQPSPLDSTPFQLVEHVNDLEKLMFKLQEAEEFAVDLEHNQYRSFQGLTCLMQISTRTEDFIIDTLKLHGHVGAYLREVFRDSCKRKVMHGADKDILWLQRDFGIYVCNLFDTGQASKVLNLERRSLSYLLIHFCGITANKEYQNADWRLRPLPEDMIKYAREDTHYLLYIHDLMREKLLSDANCGNGRLLEVYQRSYDTCMQLYIKDRLMETSFLHIYGLQEAGFNAEQLSAVAALSQWRDAVARAEDESTGYILPNRSLIEIARHLPVTASKLRHFVKSKHPYVERNLSTVVDVIKKSVRDAAAFEAVSERLKKSLCESELRKKSEGSEVASNCVTAPRAHTKLDSSLSYACKSEKNVHCTESSNALNAHQSTFLSTMTTSHLSRGLAEAINQEAGLPMLRQLGARASVPSQKKPNRAFGVMFGQVASKKNSVQEKVEVKLQQITSSISLPFSSFADDATASKSVPALFDKAVDEQLQHDDEPVNAMPLNHNSVSLGELVSDSKRVEKNDHSNKVGEKAISSLLSDFEDCFRSLRAPRQLDHQAMSCPRIKSFDYTEARKLICFGEDNYEEANNICETKQRLTLSSLNRKHEHKDFQRPRRRLAFPTSGNKSATFRT